MLISFYLIQIRDEAHQGESLMDHGEVENSGYRQNEVLQNNISNLVSTQSVDKHAGIIKDFRPPAQNSRKSPLGIQSENYKTGDSRMFTSMRMLNAAVLNKKKQLWPYMNK